MFHFDWGVFWAVLAAGIIICGFISGLNPKWHAAALKKSLELQEQHINMMQEQLDLQQQIVDKLPTREHIDWAVP